MMFTGVISRSRGTDADFHHQAEISPLKTYSSVGCSSLHGSSRHTMVKGPQSLCEFFSVMAYCSEHMISFIHSLGDGILYEDFVKLKRSSCTIILLNSTFPVWFILPAFYHAGGRKTGCMVF